MNFEASHTLGHASPHSETYTSRIVTHYIAENSINTDDDGYLTAT
jgi:hypothetical protein